MKKPLNFYTIKIKNFVFFITGILFALQVQAQEQYGTPLIEGTVTVTIKRVFEEYCNDKLSTKTESQGSASTSLTGTCVSELISNWMINTTHDLRGGKVNMQNFTTTLKKGDVFNKNNDVPRYPVFVKLEEKGYGKAPCSNVYDACTEDYKAVLTDRGAYSGMLRHSEGREAIFSCGIIGLENCRRYLFFYVTVGLSGLSEKNCLPGESNYLTCEDNKDVWKKGAGKSGFGIVNEPFASCAFTISDDISNNWFGSDGIYMHDEIDEDGNFSKKEMQLMSIDTSVFFKYMREKPPMQTFSATGSYHEEYGNDKTGHLTKSSAIISVTLTLGKIAPEAEVTLAGCSELGVGEEGEIIATGKPEGGTYKFRTDPIGTFTEESDGATLKLTGMVPQEGTVSVEYTSPGGKKAQVSKKAVCLELKSYNGGQPIPKIALFDIDGKSLSGIKNISVAVQPSDAADLLRYVPADPGILSAHGQGNQVMLQGIRKGKTTLQAKTKCGGTTGTAADVEVVYCDDETIAKLNEMMRVAQEAGKEQAKEIERIRSSKEFEDASNDLAESAGNLAIKTTGLIIGTLGGIKAGAGVKTATEIYGKGSNILDIMKGGDITSQISNVLQLAVELGGSDIQQAIAGTIETVQAATEFGNNLGTLKGADIQLQNANKWANHWNKTIEDISRRQRICRKGTEQTSGQEGTTAKPATDKAKPNDQPSKSTEPTKTNKTSSSEKPSGDKTSTGETPSDNPSTGEMPTDEPATDDDDIYWDPPFGEPPVTQLQVGLPYLKDECGCNKSQGLGIGQKGLSTLQTGMENLGECVEKFSLGPLSEYMKTLEEWVSLSDSLGAAAKSGPAALQSLAKDAVPRIVSLLERTKSFDEAGKAFLEEFKACPESMTAGVEILQSAMRVTIDSLSTQY
jgi:hypothetical protein